MTATLRQTFLRDLQDTAKRFKCDAFNQTILDELVADIKAGRIERANNTVEEVVRKTGEWFQLDNLVDVQNRWGENFIVDAFRRRLRQYTLIVQNQEDWNDLLHEDSRTIQQTEDMVRESLASSTALVAERRRITSGDCDEGDYTQSYG